MPKIINVAEYIGKKYGKLTILSKAPRKDKGNNTRFYVECDCGNVTEVYYRHLRSGNNKSCGCLSKERIYRTKDGLRWHPLYQVWYNMVSRCANPEDKDFVRYGQRGISVCDEWKKSLTIFYNWAISNGYEKGLKLDRRENNGNYEPDNCRFLTPKENSRNTRTNRYISYKGETKTMIEWAEIFSIKYAVLKTRMRAGWDFEKAVTQKVEKYNSRIKLSI